MAGKDVTNLIERLEIFEQRLGVRLEAISAFESEPYDGESEVTVRGELHASAGNSIEGDIKLQMSIYDPHVDGS